MLKKCFKINNSIYPDEIIKSAIEDFSEVSSISYKNSELTINGETDSDIEETFLEFMNYSLGLYNELI